MQKWLEYCVFGIFLFHSSLPLWRNWKQCSCYCSNYLWLGVFVLFQIPGAPDDEAVRIFLEFERVESAIKGRILNCVLWTSELTSVERLNSLTGQAVELKRCLFYWVAACWSALCFNSSCCGSKRKIFWRQSGEGLFLQPGQVQSAGSGGASLILKI